MEYATKELERIANSLEEIIKMIKQEQEEVKKYRKENNE